MSDNSLTKNGRKKAIFISVIAFLAIGLICASVFFFTNFTFYNKAVYKNDITELKLSADTKIDTEKISRFDRLTLLDLSETSPSVSQIDTLTELLPDCEMLWNVPFSFGSVRSDASQLDFSSAASDDFALLKYFVSLEKVDASGCTDYEMIENYRTQLPTCEFVWTVEICSEKYPSTTTELTIGSAQAADLEKLRYLPELTHVDASGCTDYETLSRIKSELPGCNLEWTVDIAGQTFSSDTESIDLSGRKVSDVDALRKALLGLPDLKELVMCDCGLSNETMAQLRDDFPNIKVVWKVYFAIYSLRTDTKVFSTMNGTVTQQLTSKDLEALQYCTDLELLDLGHNIMTNTDALASLTNLKVLILSCSALNDISFLTNMPELEWFEAFNTRLSDITAVSTMKSLTHFNCANSYVTDISPLYELENLEYIWLSNCPIKKGQRDEIKEKFPDSKFDFRSAVDGGWRTCDKYRKLQNAFTKHNYSTTYEW